MSGLFSPFVGANVRISNRIVMPPMATEKSDEDGTVDFVGMGRALVSDPVWIGKARKMEEAFPVSREKGR
jgi:2,4-dienoyl-CoA reductase-like NADH-dependent reductase (Old Yellow Enzyme family)